MTGDPDNLDTTSNEPIDADFIPAPNTKSASAKSGPGWISLAVASLLAAGTGGAIGVTMGPSTSGNGGSSGELVQIAQSLDALQNSQSQAQNEINQLTQSAADLEKRLKKNIQDAISTNGPSEDLTGMIEELNAVSERLESNVGTSLTDEDLVALTARLEALETAGASDDATPEDIRRSLAALSERYDQIEASTTELETSFEARFPAIESLTERLSDVEVGLEALLSGSDENGDETLTEITEQVAKLRSEMDELSTTPSAELAELKSQLSKLEAQESDALAEARETERKAEAALALTTLEPGSNVGADVRQLAKQFPSSQPIQTLARLADENPPTISELTEQFARVKSTAEASLAEDAKVGGALGWLDRTFGDAVTVKKSDAAALPNAVMDAEAALNASDVETAMNAIQKISDKELNALFEQWETNAARHLAYQNSLNAARDALKKEINQ